MPPEVDPNDVRGARMPYSAAAQKPNGKAPHVDDWGVPEPLDAASLPPFPVDAFPAWLRDWVSAEASFCQVPIDLPASVAIATVSLAAARAYQVQVRAGWTEPMNIWTLTGLPPGERKSPVFTEGTAPVYEFCAAEAERLAPTIKDRDRERRVIAEQIKGAECAAAKGRPYNGREALAEAHELDALLSGKPEIRAPKLIADDCTAEALAKVLAENYESMALFSSEGGPFEVLAGRYSDGPNLELHLKAHSGDPHIVDRISRAPIVLRSPLLVVCMTVQPVVIHGLAASI
jgi:hypothetical protein